MLLEYIITSEDISLPTSLGSLPSIGWHTRRYSLWYINKTGPLFVKTKSKSRLLPKGYSGSL